MRAQNTNWNKLRTIIIILLCHAKSLSYSPKRGAISAFELANFLTASNPRTLPEPCGEQTDAVLHKSKSCCVIGHPLQLNLIVWVWDRIDRFSSPNNDLFTMKKQSKTYCIWQDVEITQKMRCFRIQLFLPFISHLSGDSWWRNSPSYRLRGCMPVLHPWVPVLVVKPPIDSLFIVWLVRRKATPKHLSSS